MDGRTQDETATPEGGLATRWVELIFALLAVTAGSVVIYDSLRIGAQWASDGPQAGYFPWLTGTSLALAGAWISAKVLVRWKRLEGDVFVTWTCLRRVLAMLLPTIAYVVVIRLVGIYVASAVFIAAFMLWQGHYRLLPSVSVALAIPIAMFLLFEIWFLVALPKGPIERMLGY